MTKIRLVTVSFRIVSIASRALLIYVFAFLAAPAQVSLFALLNAYVGLFVIFNGFDLTRAVQRDLKLRCDEVSVTQIFASILSFFAIYYLIFLVLSVSSSVFFGFDLILAFCFFGLVLFEHLSQEAGRILVVSNRQYVTSVALLIRSFFPLLSLCLLYLTDLSIGVELLFFVLVTWSMVAFFYSWFAVIQLYGLQVRELYSFDVTSLKYIRQCFSYSALFFLATVGAKSIFALDKTFIDIFWGDEMLATYALVLGVGMISVPLVDILFGSYSLPRFFEELGREGVHFRKVFKEYLFKSFLFLILFYSAALVLLLVLFPVFFPTYGYQSFPLFALTILFPILFAANIIPSQILVVFSKAKILAISSVISVVISVILSVIFNSWSIGVFVAFVSGMSFLLVSRCIFAFRQFKTEKLS